VRLGGLRIRHFRNLGKQELSFPPQGAALVGDNAHGKSNLLEAIYYLETFRSFRGARDRDLVAFGEEAFHLEGRLEAREAERGGAEGTVSAGYQRTGGKKKVAVDGVEPDRIGDALGRLAGVIFSPADVAIVSEGPSERRRFLDIVLCLNASGYLEALQRFRHILAQRNAALRDEQPESAVRAWDEALVETGATVIEARFRWVERWTEPFAAYCARVSGGEEVRMRYEPSVQLDGAETAEEIEEACRLALARTAERERRVGNTVVGPHRDEVGIELPKEERSLSVRDFGSGGQQRTAALALHLVEADTVREARGREPLILMDDVFAELDPGRSERVLELFDEDECSQVILTAPKESDVKVRGSALPRWTIRNGTVHT